LIAYAGLGLYEEYPQIRKTHRWRCDRDFFFPLQDHAGREIAFQMSYFHLGNGDLSVAYDLFGDGMNQFLAFLVDGEDVSGMDPVVSTLVQDNLRAFHADYNGRKRREISIEIFDGLGPERNAQKENDPEKK
jgi:hypothetical protein